MAPNAAPRARNPPGLHPGPRGSSPGRRVNDRSRHGPESKSTRCPRAHEPGTREQTRAFTGATWRRHHQASWRHHTRETDMSVTTEKSAGATAISPFHIEVPQEEIDELRRRAQATRWPDKETVNDRSQGVQLARLRPLVEYWGTGYDWRKVEARLNALPQFITEIDGLDIQFAHIRSPHIGALPLLMTHGWPGSIVELLKVIEPLTNPTAHGGSAEDAFHLVLPTMPGYGFSGKPTAAGWNSVRMANAFHELMLRLGYPRYVSQGGDWGAIISELLAVQAPEGLLGIHINMPGTVPPDVLRHLRNFDPAPAELSDREKVAYDRLLHFYRDGFGYAAMMNQSPQTIGYALADSPVAMAAFYYDKFAEWTDTGGAPEKSLSYDEMLDAITLYWITNTG